MRNIIFRGKRLDNEAWVYGDLIENQGRYFIYHAMSETTIEDNDDGRIVVAAVEVDPATVGQYTGLKDRYGDRIWEGDILRSENGYAEPIGWSQDNAGFATMDFANGEYIYEIDQFLASTKTISGTIHDNPDLLK